MQHAPLQPHATVLALQPSVLALQPSVPHLSHFTIGRLGVGRLLEHLRAPDHLPEPAAHVHRALLREIPPARRTPIPPPHLANAADAAHVTLRTTRPVPSLVRVLGGTQAEARQHRVPLRALVQVRPAAAREGVVRISRPPVTPPWAPPHVDRQARL